MKKLALSSALICSMLLGGAQVTATPDKLWGRLFTEVQLKRAMGDNKTFVDMVPQGTPDVILRKFANLKTRDSASLRNFVLANFYLPPTPEITITPDLSLNQHLTDLWSTLTRTGDKKVKYSSLLPLPESYIVPGGRFREIYYWDSYFTMQGLAVSNRYDLIEDMLDNFKYLIDTYGHIPNGNRNYYLSRSQPPYFALMVELLQQKNGPRVYQKYFSAMEKEYKWWMQGTAQLKTLPAYRRVVKMPDGSLLNRYWDDSNTPRQESYAEDVTTAQTYSGKDKLAFVNLRAGAESGWDFSSRWFGDTLHLSTIQTTSIVPVDLNSLLYAYEMILSNAAGAGTSSPAVKAYRARAQKRKSAIIKYCWNKELAYFFDYDRIQKHTTDKWTAAGIMPLFCSLAEGDQAAGVLKAITGRLLKDGGVVTTIYNTGQQWDAPNGWAPLQFIAVKGLMNYGYNDVAKTIAERWMAVNEKIFASRGRMLEKYNVEDISLESGGGEYPTQDGFGWTNGVYLKFYELFGTAQK